MKKLFQKIKCSIPFSFSYFLHKPVVVRNLSEYADLIKCVHCGKRFAMNHLLQSILPWDDELKIFYDNFNKQVELELEAIKLRTEE